MEYIVINYLFDKGETVSEGICFTSKSKVTGLILHHSRQPSTPSTMLTANNSSHHRNIHAAMEYDPPTSLQPRHHISTVPKPLAYRIHVYHRTYPSIQIFAGPYTVILQPGSFIIRG